MQKTAAFFLKLFGWKIHSSNILPADKCVLVIAPHTSFTDFIIGKIYTWALNIRGKFIIKDSFFIFPLGLLMRALGGIPINREQSKNTVKYCVRMFEKYEKMGLVIAPEGTRKKTDKWKKGFYFIATQANVPIYLTYIDYKKKTGGILKEFIPSGCFEKDIIEIQQLYKGIAGRHPKNFNMY